MIYISKNSQSQIMTTSQLGNQLIDHTKGPPRETLEEIIDFIQLIRLKNER